MFTFRLLFLFLLLMPRLDEGSGLDPHGAPRTAAAYERGSCIDPNGCNGTEGGGAMDPNGGRR